MRRDVASGGAWLAGTGITSIIGYLIATVAAGGRHSDWPYLLFGTLAVVGVFLYAMGRSNRPRESRLPSDRGASSGEPPYGGETRGNFTSLADGAKVHHGDLVTGTVTGILPRMESWLLARSVQSGTFVDKQKLFLDIRNEFRVPVQLHDLPFRDEYKEEFLLLLVVANYQTLRRWVHVGRGDLPSGVRILDQRTVILTSGHDL